MIAVGVPAAIAEQNAKAFSLIAAGDAEWLSDDTTKILGHPGRTFQQFAEDHATAFDFAPAACPGLNANPHRASGLQQPGAGCAPTALPRKGKSLRREGAA